MPSRSQTIAAFIATLIAFVTIDAAWIALVAVGQFRAAIGDIMLPEPRLLPALAFYFVYTAGLVVLAIRPAASSGSAAVKGGVLGMTAYATFDLTNLAIIKGWTVPLALLDIGWGSFVSALAATVGFAVASRQRA